MWIISLVYCRTQNVFNNNDACFCFWRKKNKSTLLNWSPVHYLLYVNKDCVSLSLSLVDLKRICTKKASPLVCCVLLCVLLNLIMAWLKLEKRPIKQRNIDCESIIMVCFMTGWFDYIHSGLVWFLKPSDELIAIAFKFCLVAVIVFVVVVVMVCNAWLNVSFELTYNVIKINRDNCFNVVFLISIDDIASEATSSTQIDCCSFTIIEFSWYLSLFPVLFSVSFSPSPPPSRSLFSFST